MTACGKLMKRFLLLFFCLLIVVNVFAAESDDLKVLLKIDKYQEVAFTKDPYTSASDELASMSDSVDLGTITGGNKSSEKFYASAKTNWSTPFKMTIYGTALTLDSENSSTPIPLTVAVVDDNNNAGDILHSATFTEAWNGTNDKPDSTKTIVLIEGESSESLDGKAGTSARPLTWALKASVANVDALEGSYEACLWLEVEPGQL